MSRVSGAAERAGAPGGGVGRVGQRLERALGAGRGGAVAQCHHGPLVDAIVGGDAAQAADAARRHVLADVA
jgi:DNA-binding FadR family transcriptional regulator